MHFVHGYLLKSRSPTACTSFSNFFHVFSSISFCASVMHTGWSRSTIVVFSLDSIGTELTTIADIAVRSVIICSRLPRNLQNVLEKTERQKISYEHKLFMHAYYTVFNYCSLLKQLFKIMLSC